MSTAARARRPPPAVGACTTRSRWSALWSVCGCSPGVASTATKWASSIDAWKHVRPPQPKFVDRKTGERREFLFCIRGEHIGPAYLNGTVLPALCRKGGIPEFGSRRALTRQRARSAIASQLLDAPEPLSIAELEKRLGHKHFSSTRHYAAHQVLVDRETILSGAATGGERPWRDYGRRRRVTAPTTSSPNVRAGWPAPAARSTSPRSPARHVCWKSKTASTRCSNASPSPTTNAPHVKATATPLQRWPTASGQHVAGRPRAQGARVPVDWLMRLHGHGSNADFPEFWSVCPELRRSWQGRWTTMNPCRAAGSAGAWSRLQGARSSRRTAAPSGGSVTLSGGFARHSTSVSARAERRDARTVLLPLIE